MLSLYSMNITQATLFPGLDGMARALAYELEYHWEYNPKTMVVHPDFVDNEDPHSFESERKRARRGMRGAAALTLGMNRLTAACSYLGLPGFRRHSG
jgi:hypothetical protein